jgi:mono/diheme cytochrome c family protein
VLKKPVILRLIITLFLSLVMINPPITFGDKIDYKKIFKNDCQKCHERDGKGSKRGKEPGVPDFTDA